MADTKVSKTVEGVNGNVVIIKKVIEFLQLFLPLTLAKRLVAIVLLAAGVPVPRVTELSGLCDRSTRSLLKSLREEDVAGLLAIKRGSGKKRRTAGLEDEIIAEIERNNYHTRQQIADMIANIPLFAGGTLNGSHDFFFRVIFHYYPESHTAEQYLAEKVQTKFVRE